MSSLDKFQINNELDVEDNNIPERKNMKKDLDNCSDGCNSDLIDKKTNAEDNLSIFCLIDFPKRKNKELIKLFKDFIKNFFKFYSIRALISLIKQIRKFKFKLNKFSFNDLREILFNSNNLRTGLFLSIMPFVFYLLTEIIFDVNSNNNYFDNGFSSLKDKIIVLLSGFISAFIGISISEKGISIMNYIILSVLTRSIHSLIVVILKKKGKNTQSKFWVFLTFYIACFGFLFSVYYNPGYKPNVKLYCGYANFQGNEKEEILSLFPKTNLFK